MLKNAKEDGLTAWVRAKMALRAGDAITAAAWFAQAAASFLPNEAWGFQQSSDDIISEEFVTLVCRIHAQQAILALNRDDYLQAMWLMYQAKENYWPDVAHIAERVLTVNELIAFVDKYVPAPSPSDLNMPKNAGRESADARLRNLLARRLMRTGQ